jgi:hypothetical protein
MMIDGMALTACGSGVEAGVEGLLRLVSFVFSAAASAAGVSKSGAGRPPLQRLTLTGICSSRTVHGLARLIEKILRFTNRNHWQTAGPLQGWPFASLPLPSRLSNASIMRVLQPCAGSAG